MNFKFKCVKCGFTHTDPASFNICKGCGKNFCCFCFKDSLEYCRECFILNEVKKAGLENKDRKPKKYRYNNKKKNLIYSRVTEKQFEGNLKVQIDFIMKYTNLNNIKIDEIIKEVGHSFSLEREKLVNLIDEAEKNKINYIFVVSKDRFIRSGFDWYERYLRKFGTKIKVVKNFKGFDKNDEIKDLLYYVYYYSYHIPGFIAYIEKMEKELPKLGD